MHDISTIPQLIDRGEPDATAITAPGGAPLAFGPLQQLIGDTVRELNALGIARNDRVAIVLPNGPTMATAFLAVASAAATAPLNPGYRAAEFDFYLRDLNARALIVEAGAETPARDVAESLGIPVIELTPRPDDAAGRFDLHPRSRPEPVPGAHTGPAGVDDVALVLHTSGTTSRPKIVPLTHRNLCASADNIGATLRLDASDRCLNIMPLFHIHGLVAGVLAPLAACGSVACAPGFNALKVFAWFDELRPTWYTAVPTMHQAILARAGRNEGAIEATPLRLIRSSSSSLPPQVMEELETVFGCPVIESYGMTEAAHQMTSNPLPPAPRKAGSVGVPAGPEVAVMDVDGNFLPQGTPGEVAIRGANVTPGYENNPEANAKSFTGEWFRTGDEGVFDVDGYLTITGRLKEMINRGGEKVAPVEVDTVLMDHVAVSQAVTFAVPHPKLGEEVAAAIVFHPDADPRPDARAIRAFAADRLADHKVPRTVVFVDEIPKGATGKLQRIGLAEKLGLVET